MLSKIPANFSDLAKSESDQAILRAALIAEYDAINLYKEMAELAKDKNLKILLNDIAREEKTHVAEFMALLNHLDDEQLRELKAGQREVDEMLDL